MGNKLITYIKEEEFDKLLKAEKKKEFRLTYLLAFTSGLRISEIKHLKKENINLVAKTIFLKECKFSKDRVVPLPKTWKNYMIDIFPLSNQFIH
jgi:integrase